MSLDVGGIQMHSKKRYFSPIVLKFFFAFSILLVLSTLLLMLFFSHIGQQNIIQQAQQRISNLIFLSEEQLSQKLTRLENQMLMLMVNNNLNDAMVKFHQEGKKFIIRSRLTYGRNSLMYLVPLLGTVRFIFF